MNPIFTLPKYWTLLLILTLVYAANCSSIQCLTLRGEQHDIIDARQMLNTEENILNCMTQSIRKGRTTQTRSILDLYDQQYSQKMIQVLEKQLNHLELIEQQLIQGQSNCAPVIKWGQNLTHIFLTMKMSHRWDSPPCLNTKSQSKNQTSWYFEYVNICVVSHQKMTFNLSLNLYENVKQQPPLVIKDGVGTYSTIMEKVEPKVWAFLDKNQIFYPIWEEIADRYNPVHKEYSLLIDQVLRERKAKAASLEAPKNRQKKSESNEEGSKQNKKYIDPVVEKLKQFDSEVENNSNEEQQNIEQIPQETSQVSEQNDKVAEDPIKDDQNTQQEL